jgi:hypothetical protein
MELKRLDKSWQCLTDSIRNDYPDWFFEHLQLVMEHVFIDLEGGRLEWQEKPHQGFFAYGDMFELATNRYQLLKDFELGFLLFECREGFQTMNPASCAREIIGMR